ncbi:reverse transcriptase [Gossypium australe]|uniref:Reverse transcriptase n=1 Tax=Gossypium australe TaxID=47621 RepID=A0A5B6WIR7_9ROSI|nr:reverse transcriptase [Gossypium australe]
MALTAAYKEEEIFEALKDMGKEVSQYCLGVLNNGMDLELMNVTNIILIPKILNPTSMENFRPISLCNVIYKVIAKMSAFMSERLISDNILLAYEILHTFSQKRNGRKGLMALKMDMSKAYDRVE